MISRRQKVKQANDNARTVLKGRTQANGHLGDLAFWSLDPSFLMACDVVQDAVRAQGVDPDTTLPETTGHVTAFGRAVESVRAAIRSAGYTLLDAAKGANGERRVAVLAVARNGQVSTQDLGTVTCPGDGTAPYIERTDSAGIAQAVIAKSNALLGMYTSDDLRISITGLFQRWGALPCRERPSVVYWVPPGGTEEIERFNTALVALGAGEISQFAGYSHDARSARAVTQAVNTGLENKLNEFATEAQAFTERVGVIRGGPIERVMGDCAKLVENANLYRAILGSAVDSIDTRIATIQNALRARLENSTAAE